MAQTTTIKTQPKTWTLLTDSDVSKITFQNTGRYEIFIKATESAVAPTDKLGALSYLAGIGERNVLLTDLFPGITTPARVYAICNENGDVAVGHA